MVDLQNLHTVKIHSEYYFKLINNLNVNERNWKTGSVGDNFCHLLLDNDAGFSSKITVIDKVYFIFNKSVETIVLHKKKIIVLLKKNHYGITNRLFFEVEIARSVNGERYN